KTAKERMGQDVNLQLNLITFDTKKQDPRRYNLPTASEVGIIINKDFSGVNAARDLIIEHRGGRLKRISELHSAYLPLRFPLLFPYGEPGWHPKISFSGIPWQHQDDDGDEEQQRDGEEAEDAGGEADGTRGTLACFRSSMVPDHLSSPFLYPFFA